MSEVIGPIGKRCLGLPHMGLHAMGGEAVRRQERASIMWGGWLVYRKAGGREAARLEAGQ